MIQWMLKCALLAQGTCPLDAAFDSCWSNEMWNIWAITFIAIMGLALFSSSLFLAKRETLDELTDFFDVRAFRQSLKSIRRFGFSAFIWLSAYVAVVISVLQAHGGSRVGFLMLPLLTCGFLLARVAITSLHEPSARQRRRLHRFPRSNDNNAKLSGEIRNRVTSDGARTKQERLWQMSLSGKNRPTHS